MDESRRSLKFKMDTVEAYQQHIDHFKELLLILIHICGGGLAHAIEILDI
jgi:hypothetical protein